MKRAAARFASPAGLLLGLLLFLFLPFASVSCDAGVGDIRAEYSGLDVVTASESELDIPPAVAQTFGSLRDAFREADDEAEPEGAPPDVPPVPSAGVLPAVLAGAVVLAVLAGLGMSLLSARRARLRGIGYASGAAALLLVVAQIATQYGIADAVLATARDSGDERRAQWVERVLDSLIVSGAGFWLPLILLLAVAVVCVFMLNWKRWRRHIPVVVTMPSAAPDPPQSTVRPPDVPGTQ